MCFFNANKVTGGHQISEVEQLSKEERIKRQEAYEAEIKRFNDGHDKHRYDFTHNVKTSDDFEHFNALLQEDINYVNNSNWREEKKQEWHKNYNYYISKCKPTILANLKKVLDKEEKMNNKYN